MIQMLLTELLKLPHSERPASLGHLSRHEVEMLLLLAVSKLAELAKSEAQ